MKFVKALLFVMFLATFTLQANSETSWITKKSEKSETEIKLEKKNKIEKKKKSKWIKKKNKENDKKIIKKVEEKIKESKSWISKKSKDEKKIIKKKLKEYYSVNNLPKGDLYFIAKISPKDASEKFLYLYGYLNSENTSAKFKYNNNSYYSKNKGFAYFEDKKNSCEVNTFAGVLNNKMKGDAVLNCTNKLTITGDFKQVGSNAIGTGKTTEANNVDFEFYTSKRDAIVHLNFYKEKTKTVLARNQTAPRIKKTIVKPEGKYYALIIANSEYDNKENWSDLVSPSNDAKAIKKIFDKKYKFHKTWLVENATRGEIYEEFEKLKSVVTDKDYLLIYYSGHGQTDINNVAYWIPKEGSDKYYTWVNVNSLTNTLEDIKAKHILFMIDSCYSGLTFKSQNITDKDLVNDKAVIEEALLYYSRKVLTSGTGKKRVLDAIPGEKHSLFAKGFIKELKENKGNLRAEQIWQKLKYYHKGKTIKQVPAFGTIDALSLSDSNGDFVFHMPIKK